MNHIASLVGKSSVLTAEPFWNRNNSFWVNCVAKIFFLLTAHQKSVDFIYSQWTLFSFADAVS